MDNKTTVDLKQFENAINTFNEHLKANSIKRKSCYGYVWVDPLDYHIVYIEYDPKIKEQLLKTTLTPDERMKEYKKTLNE
ncbi:MAG: hypothetical protein PHG06_00285 [Parabacteroides sp.]|nr:hypothetical protein [Parabacteroides sp.]